MADFSNPGGDYNPYAPPAALPDFPLPTPDDAAELIPADRSTRLGAQILDGLVLFAAMVPMMGALGMSGFYRYTSRAGGGGLGSTGDTLMVLGLGLMLVPFGLIGYQWYLTAKLGQSLGKKWLGLRIVKVDGSPVDFVSGVILRSWVIGVACNIPYIGWLVWLADVLTIFSDDRRCLHDRIAGTKVVLALPKI